MIVLTVNGAARRFEAPLDVASLLEKLEMAGKKVAVERNGEIVPKSAHAETLLARRRPARDRGRGRRRLNERRARHRRQELRLAPAGRHRQVPAISPRRAPRSRPRARRSSPSRSAAPTSARTAASRACSRCCRLRSSPILPNTAGCYTRADAVRTLRLARELLDGHDLVKLEVLGDPHTLYPNMPETLRRPRRWSRKASR